MMKKLLFSLIALVAITGSTFAQDAKSSFKKAKSALLASYNAGGDTEKQLSKLGEAREAIAIATAGISDFDAKKVGKVWKKSGEINNTIAATYFTLTSLGQQVERNYPDAAMVAYDSYTKALGTDGLKKYDKKEILKELLGTATYLSQDGIDAYSAKKYESAYDAFIAVKEIQKLTEDNGSTPVFAEATNYHEHLYRTALSAQLAKKNEEAKGVYKMLIDAGYKDAGVYGGMYNIYTEEKNEEEALAMLNKGREQFPDDENLKIYEINYYLNAGKLDQLVGKLENAIASDPKNLSLYSTLGHVYDNLHQREAEAGNADAAKAYFDKALSYYEQALVIDGSYVPALYNTGALYYNAAAQVTRELVSLDGDFTAAGLRKYEAKKAEMISMFDKALPFFQKSESLNPNDLGTLSALKEIYARKDDLKMSNEFKERMDKVQNGEAIEKAYF